MYYNYNFFDDLLNFRKSFDDLFKDVPAKVRRSEYPSINIYEENDFIEVEALLPGVNGEDVSLTLSDETLIIEGERFQSDKKIIKSERDFGKYKRIVNLPYRVDREKIEANFTDGLLRVKLEKSPELKPRKIEIK